MHAGSLLTGGAPAACRNHRITEQVVIGTHGTLKNLVSKRILLFRHIRILVFDEADEMLKVLHAMSWSLATPGCHFSQSYPAPHMVCDIQGSMQCSRMVCC